METVEGVKAEIERLATILSAPPDLLPTYGSSDGTGRRHLEIEPVRMFYVVSERGTEFKRLMTLDRDELHYWVFDGVTFSIASKWELAHRVEDQDVRKLVFTKQFELLDQLSPTWSQRRQTELGHLLGEAGL